MASQAYIVTCVRSRDIQLHSYDNYSEELTNVFTERFGKDPKEATEEELIDFIDELELENFFEDEDTNGAWYDTDGEVVVGIAIANSPEEAINNFINNPFDKINYSAYRLYK